MANPQYPGAPPHDPDVERAALGAIMGNDAMLSLATVDHGLTPESFYVIGHQTIFRHMQAMAAQDRGYVDPLKLGSRLRADGTLDEFPGGFAYFQECMELAVIPQYAPIHFQSVRDFHERRQAIQAAREIIEEATRGDAEPGFLQRIPQKFHDLMPKARDEASIASTMDQSIELWSKVQSGEIEMIGLSTGFHEIDQVLGGLQGGVHVIGARPSAGKTSLEGCIANHQCALGNAVARVSMDLTPKAKLLERDLCRQASVSLNKLQHRYSFGNDFAKLKAARDEIAQWPMHILSGVFDVAKICSWARTMKQRHDIKLLTLDYIQLCTAPHIKSYDPVRVIAYCSANIKELGDELGIPVLMLAQLNRGNARDKRPPELSDLKGCGDLEQHAATAILLSEEERFDYEVARLERNKQRAIYCNVAKNQQGGTGAMSMWFLCPYFKMQVAPDDWGFPGALPWNQDK
jgi:replicative DNA helicase